VKNVAEFGLFWKHCKKNWSTFSCTDCWVESVYIFKFFPEMFIKCWHLNWYAEKLYKFDDKCKKNIVLIKDEKKTCNLPVAFLNRNYFVLIGSLIISIFPFICIFISCTLISIDVTHLKLFYLFHFAVFHISVGIWASRFTFLSQSRCFIWDFQFHVCPVLSCLVFTA